MTDQDLLSMRLRTMSALIDRVFEPEARPSHRRARRPDRQRGRCRGHRQAPPFDSSGPLVARVEIPESDPVVRALRVLGPRVLCVGTQGKPCPPLTEEEWDGRTRRFYLDGRPADARRLIAAANAMGADIAYPGLSPRQRAAGPSPLGWV